MKSTVIGTGKDTGPHAVYPGLPATKRALRNRARLTLLGCWLTIAAILAAIGYFSGLWWLPVAILGVQVVVLAFLANKHVKGGRKRLRMEGVHPVTQRTQPVLYALIEDVTQRMGMEMPPTWIIEDREPNAFATMTGWRTYTFVITTGYLSLATAEQTRGVIGHELGHILNKDMLLKFFVRASSGAQFLRSPKEKTPSYVRDRRPVIVRIASSIWSVFATVTSLIAKIIEKSVSRSRESLADLTAAEALGGPESMIAACRFLLQVEESRRQGRMHATSRIADLGQSHPYTDKRIILLQDTCGEQASRLTPRAADRLP